MNNGDVCGKAGRLGSLALIDVEDGVREVAGADDYVCTFVLSLRQYSCCLTQHGWFF